jgi:succinate-acetate transporter protein
MWQLILRGLVVAVLRRVFVVIAAPFVLLIATPVILLRASILAVRKQQKFKFAALDGYGSVWEFIAAALMFPFYSDMDRIKAARRKSSNQALQPTTGRSDD